MCGASYVKGNSISFGVFARGDLACSRGVAEWLPPIGVQLPLDKYPHRAK